MLNKNFLIILLGNVVLGSALPVLIVLGVLAGGWLAPQDWLATAPPSVSMVAGIVVAQPVSQFMGRYGRRMGFLLGALTLTGGGLVGSLALWLDSFALLCVAHAALGAALVCINYFRFAAAEAVAVAFQPQAISLTLASGLVAALIGPELFSWSKDMMAPIPLAGAYAAIAGLGLLGMLPILGLSLPKPETHRGASATQPFAATVRQIIDTPKIALAVGIAALSQFVMVLVMTPTPLAMIGCGFAQDQAADVIGWHVVAMFAPGFVTGSLIKRFGSGRIAAAGLLLIIVAAGLALLGLALVNFYVALIVLGIGWNFGFVSGTYMLQAAAPKEQTAAFQGANETILAISSAAASLLSGALFAGLGWFGLVGLAIPATGLLCLLLLRTRARVAV